MRLAAALLVQLVFALISAAANAADIKVDKVANSELFTVRVTGMFQKGDGEKFEKAVAPLPDLFVVVLLNGNGGDLDSALAIGTEIMHRGFSTAVQAGVICASACAFAWLAGDTRYMEPSSKIGFHAAYIEAGRLPLEKGQPNALVGAYLYQLGISADAIKYFTRASPTDIQWLSLRDSMILGINVTIPSEIAGAP
jgi:hypothetical protein